MSKNEKISSITANNITKISDKELANIEGGAIVITTGALIGINIATAGLVAGYLAGRN